MILLLDECAWAWSPELEHCLTSTYCLAVTTKAVDDNFHHTKVQERCCSNRLVSHQRMHMTGPYEKVLSSTHNFAEIS